MTGRNYDRLSVEEFGRQLITSGDLDPVYIALARLDWSHDQLCRWLIAYWCFYHCGFASYASEHEGDHFWGTLSAAARNDIEAPIGGRWPRGSERRHARGEQGLRMVLDLENRYKLNPSEMVNYIAKGAPNYEEVARRAQEHTLFGPWISFKIADMIDRVCLVHVDFSQAGVFMFKDPVKAALMVWRKNMYGSITAKARPIDQLKAITGVIEYLHDVFADLKAPPNQDRPIDLQEVETVLCKWKSHMNGHYPLFNDIDEIRFGLLNWGKAAGEFLKAMPPGYAE